MTCPRPLQEGDIVFAPVTDHPDFPTVMHEGETGYFRERDDAELVASAWNSYGGGWSWYVREFCLLPRRTGESDTQMDMEL